MITPLLTQLTYEGLIDECFSIKNCAFCFCAWPSSSDQLHSPRRSPRFPPHSSREPSAARCGIDQRNPNTWASEGETEEEAPPHHRYRPPPRRAPRPQLRACRAEVEPGRAQAR